MYDKEYYEHGIESGKSCYSNYRWIPELTIPMCSRIVEHLGIGLEDTVLDFGCAKGFSVHALRLLGRQCWGYDISEYAVSLAPSESKDFVFSDLSCFDKQLFDWIIAKDVLEHVTYEDIDDVLSWIKSKTENVFVVVPLGDGEVYNVPAYELDKTHIIRENLNWWEKKIKDSGFLEVSCSYLIPGLKDNWSHFEQGNGFFVGGVG
jgi:SAM-dependent methyltransferase